MVVVERSSRSPEPTLAGRHRRQRGASATARPRFGTVTPLRTQRTPRRPDAPSRLPRVLRPGHQRAPRHRPARRGLFDEVIVAVGVNVSKNRLFTAEERLAMLEQGVAGLGNVRVEGFTGLITTYCREAGRRRHRQGAALGDRLRLRAADGADERAPDRGRDRLRARGPAVRRSSPPAWSRRWRRTAATCPAWCPTSCSARSPRGSPAKGPVEPHLPGGRIWLPPRSPRTILDWICLPGPGSDTEQLGPESAARARHSRARPPPGVPARGVADGAGAGRSGHRSPSGPRGVAGRARPAPRGGHGGGAGHRDGARLARGRVRAVPGADLRRHRRSGSRSCSSTRTTPSPRRTTRSARCRATWSTWSRCCGTRWCSHCRSSRCAWTTVPACAPSVGHDWPTTPTTHTRRRSTRGGRRWPT